MWHLVSAMFMLDPAIDMDSIPEEIAWLLAYLASPAGDFYSGTTITLDGGRDNWAGPWPPRDVATESGDLPAEQRRHVEP